MTSSQHSNVKVTIIVMCLNSVVTGSRILLHPLSLSRRVKPLRKIALNSNGEVNCRELARRPWFTCATTELVRGTPTAGVLLHWVIIFRRWEQNHKHNRERPINTDSPRKKSVTVQWPNHKIPGPQNTHPELTD